MNDPPYLPTRLTDQQRAAILHQGSPLLIIAGPGSGKTEVLTWRVAHLVRAGLVAPEHLLVTTFTNKAALELKDRIQQKLPEVYVEGMQVGTLHAFCGDLLRRYPGQSAVPHGFHILDENGQLLFVYTRRKALGLNAVVKGRPHAFFSHVLRLFNLATEELVEPERLGEWCERQRAEAETLPSCSATPTTCCTPIPRSWPSCAATTAPSWWTSTRTPTPSRSDCSGCWPATASA
jgi:DNA helicase-2/ATP-dependent DNA helicase PcrA